MVQAIKQSKIDYPRGHLGLSNDMKQRKIRTMNGKNKMSLITFTSKF
jgi:hypothetical protein